MERKRQIEEDRDYVLQEISKLLETASRRQLDIIIAFIETLRDHPDY